MKKYMTLLAAVAVVVAGCNNKVKTDPETVDPDIKPGSIALSQESLNAGPDGEAFAVTVTSSSDWMVAGYVDWVTIETPKGKSGESLKLTVDPNFGEKALVAEFKVFSDDAAKTLTVISSPEYTIAPVGDDMDFDTSADAGSFTLILETNVDDLSVDVNGADWLTFNRAENVFGKTRVYLDVTRSQEFKARETKITVSSAHVEEPLEFSLTQAQRDTVIVEGEGRIVKDLAAYDIPLSFKSNIDVTYSLPAWLSEVSKEESEMDETGLKTTSLKLHCDAAKGSRQVTLDLKKGSTSFASVFIKQQNPNPTFVTIPDAELLKQLEIAGWVLIDPETGKGEVLEEGMSATSLTLGKNTTTDNQNDYTNILSLEGLEKFPALTSLTLRALYLHVLNMDALPNVKELTLIDMGELTDINFGSRSDLPTFKMTHTSRQRIWSTGMTFTGDFLSTIDIEAVNTSIYVDEDRLQWIDVTGCPKLETLKVTRYNRYGQSSLNTIYMTAAQQASVNVSKLDKVQIVVK